VVEQAGFPNWERLLFHINEAMSWESVRNLEKMKQARLLIQNIASQSEIPEDIQECMETVREDMDEVLSLIAQGTRLRSLLLDSTMKNKSAKQIQRHLRQALVFDMPMSQALYEYELAEHVEDFRQSLSDDQDELLFSVTEHSGDVAMMLIERTGEVYVNEDAKEKLKDAWQSALNLPS
jgi:ATP-dependent Lon protease